MAQPSTSTKPDLSKLITWRDYSQAIAKKKYWDYFVIDQFLRGNHNIKGNPNDNTIEIQKRTEQQISYPINKLYSTFRAVRAFVTRHKPVVEIDLDEGADDKAKEYARKANKVIARDNKLNNFRRLNKEWVYYGIKYGVGWRQVGYDPEKKVCIRWTIDPNDLAVGSPDGRYEDAPYLIKSVKRTVGYVKDKYKKAGEVAPDGKTAANEYAALAKQINNITGYGQKQTPDEDTVMVYECWYRTLDKNSKGGLVNKCTFIETEVLDEEETPYTEYPFIPYYSEVTPNEIGADGHLKHVIPAQRMLNLLNTQLLEYNHIVNRGRFLKDKNAGFRVIQSKEGQIIEKNPGKHVEVLNPPGVNPLLERQLTLSLDFIEDLGGQHDASMGATPQRVSSGDAIEALQTGDSNNISDLRDNFEDALAVEAAWILKMYALFEANGVPLNDQVENKTMPFAAYGKVALEKSGKSMPDKYYFEENGTYLDTMAILDENQIKVSVVSQLGETRAARMELLFKLVDLGIISGRTVLSHLEFPNTDDILEQLADEELANVAMEQMKGMGQAPGAGGPPGQLPPPNDGSQGPLPTPDMTSQLEQINNSL